LRWFWWRINAWAELASMLAGFAVGLMTTVVPILTIDDFGLRLLVITAITSAVWVAVMLATPPEDEATLEGFYRRVQPGGPGWRRQREATGLPPAVSLRLSLMRTAAAVLVLFGSMFGVGALLLAKPTTALATWGAAAAGGVALARLRDAKPDTPETVEG
jgi:hypothetical protein